MARCGFEARRRSGDVAQREEQDSTNPFPFTGGELLGVAVDVSSEHYIDLELEAAGMLCRE